MKLSLIYSKSKDFGATQQKDNKGKVAYYNMSFHNFNIQSTVLHYIKYNFAYETLEFVLYFRTTYFTPALHM